jgi:hypothetical protein
MEMSAVDDLNREATMEIKFCSLLSVRNVKNNSELLSRVRYATVAGDI